MDRCYVPAGELLLRLAVTYPEDDTRECSLRPMSILTFLPFYVSKRLFVDCRHRHVDDCR